MNDVSEVVLHNDYHESQEGQSAPAHKTDNLPIPIPLQNLLQIYILDFTFRFPIREARIENLSEFWIK
jgi:hypothetical protein